jgi:hypothetical protein
MKNWGNGSIASLFFTLALYGRKWSTLHFSCFTTCNPPNRLNRRLGGPQGQSRHYGEEKNLVLTEN